MGLRMATLQDEPKIKNWLEDGRDCMFATGKETYEKQMYDEWLAATDQFGYFLIINNEPLAYGEIWVDEEEGDLELAHLIVHPEHRGKGIGKEFVRQLLIKCRKYPYSKIYMRIVPENTRATRCYKAAGFTEEASLRNSFGGKWIWMSKENT